MNRLLAIFIAIILTAWTQLRADNQYLQRLDSAISERPHIMAAKEKRLSELRSSIAVQPKKEKRLEMYEQMYQEYLTYRYDSALVYAQKVSICQRNLETPHITNVLLSIMPCLMHVAVSIVKPLIILRASTLKNSMIHSNMNTISRISGFICIGHNIVAMVR